MKDSNYLLSQLISLYWAGWYDGTDMERGDLTELEQAHKKKIEKVYKKLAKRFKVKE